MDKEKFQKKLIEALKEEKALEEERKTRETEQIDKIKSAKTGVPITLSGYAVIDPDGNDTGKRFIRKEDAEKYMEQLRLNKKADEK